MGFSSDGSTFDTPVAAEPVLTKKALLLRNLVLGSEYLMSHITHFYHLAALDYVQGPMIAPFVKNDLTGTFNQNYFHPALKPGYGATDTFLGDAGAANQVDEINRMKSVWAKVIGDYITALHVRRLVWDAGALLSGGLPMYRSLVAGGTATVPTVSDIQALKDYLGAVKTFIDERYVPLTQIVALIYSNFDNSANSGGYGAGLNIGQGCKSFLAWGVFNLPGAKPGDAETQGVKRVLVRGYMADADASPTTVTAVPMTGLGSSPKIKEFIVKSKYTDDALNLHPKHPFDGYTDPDSGKAGAYSWGKAPRLDTGTDDVMEVGPLARMNVSQLYKKGDTPSQTQKHENFDLTPTGLSTLVIPGLGVSADTLSQYLGLGAKPTYTAGISTMDRHRARALEAAAVVNVALSWCDDLLAGGGALLNQDSFTSVSLPTSTQGFGLTEAPRGALAHFVKADAHSNIDNYQCVVPTTWNVSPDDGTGANGPIEQALTSPQQVDVKAAWLTNGKHVPVNAVRVIHSFDPCIACTVHVVKDEKLSEKGGKTR